MAIVKYALDEFSHDMESLLKAQPNQEKLFDRGSSYLSRLISNPDVIPDKYRVPTGVVPG